MLRKENAPPLRPVKHMTRTLLIALVLTGLVAVALGGAFVQLARGRRPPLFARPPAFV
ncbi:MAG: hypothetical protein ACRDKU_03145 [Gaiellaceae bacterium]